MNTMASARSSAGLARWASLGGILYVVLFVIGIIVMFDGEPNSDSSPARVIAYYSTSSHRDKINIGWIIAGLGIFFFLWFLSSLRGAVRRWEGENGYLTVLTTIGGTVYATLAFAAIALNAGIRTETGSVVGEGDSISIVTRRIPRDPAGESTSPPRVEPGLPAAAC